MLILSIDPGTVESGWCIYSTSGRVAQSSGIMPNNDMLTKIQHATENMLVIEWIEAMGMAVGRETFETVRWVGRFQQTWFRPSEVIFITRREVKLHLCGNMRAKDPNIRQALIDKLGPQGTKKAPGPTYGIRSHIWSALAIAVTAHETIVDKPTQRRYEL